MWALPFGFALTLFAGNFVHLALGSEWEPAIPLLRVFGLIFGFAHDRRAWSTMYQARGNDEAAGDDDLGDDRRLLRRHGAADVRRSERWATRAGWRRRRSRS